MGDSYLSEARSCLVCLQLMKMCEYLPQLRSNEFQAAFTLNEPDSVLYFIVVFLSVLDFSGINLCIHEF